MTSRLIPLTGRTDVSRRDVLKVIGTGIVALSTGCLSRAGDEEIVPYVADPPELRPGTPVRYTSSLVLDGFATGIIVDTREGRPIKIDGNPAHPASMGGSTPWMQARILDLYDPQRSRGARDGRGATTWSSLARRLRELPPGPLWIVLPPRSSPTLEHLLARVRERHELHVVTAGGIDHRVAYRGAALVYGQPLEVQPDLARADVVLALDADWMSCMPMSPAWARATCG
jgi:molybdopterin-containing oxidoreductase family iron-sulfur binding subunit